MSADALRLLALIVLLNLFGCSSYQIADVAKTDTALVFDLHYNSSILLLRDLTVKLYKRNPVHLPSGVTVDDRLHSLFNVPDFLEYRECGEQIETELMQAALQSDYSPDRVFCLMAGLTGMVKRSYNYKTRFYVLDRLDEQKLYKSARNMERLAWRLQHTRSDDGQLLLLSNSIEPGNINLSYERLFGKLIALQDTMASIVADRNKRSINFVMRRVGSVFFIPL